MKRTLEIFLIAGGAVSVLIGLIHALFGTASVPGGMAVNATLDSEDRFYGMIFAGWGLALIYAGRDVIGRRNLLNFLLAVFFAGGAARLISWAVAGPPHPFFIAMETLELGLPPLIWWLTKRLSAASA